MSDSDETQPRLAARNYLALIRQLGEEYGLSRGWKRSVADDLGVHPSYVSRVLSGAKQVVSPDLLERAAQRVGFDVSFFADESEEPSYRDYEPTDLGDVMLGFVLLATDERAQADALHRHAKDLLTLAERHPLLMTFHALSDALATGDASQIATAGVELVRELSKGAETVDPSIRLVRNVPDSKK